MHRLLGTLVLFFTLPASAEVVAGRNHIFFHDAWTPIAGGPLTSLGRPIESADFDGERVLAAWRDTEAVRLGLFEEGSTTPVTIAALEAAPGKPFVRWDGTRYVVVVASAPAQLAIVSRQGVIELRTTIPDTRAIVDVAASASGIALVSRYATDTHAGVIDVLLLDRAYRVGTRTSVGSTQRSTGFGSTYLDGGNIEPFGNLFYVVWRQGRSGRYDDVVGTRVLLDGSAPDTIVSRREPQSVSGTVVHDTFWSNPSPYAVLMHPYGSRLLVTSLRPYGYGLITAVVEPHGAASIAPYTMNLFFLPETTRSVRLLDGTIVVVSAQDGVATVKTLAGPVMSGPRRRSARH